MSNNPELDETLNLMSGMRDSLKDLVERASSQNAALKAAWQNGFLSPMPVSEDESEPEAAPEPLSGPLPVEKPEDG